MKRNEIDMINGKLLPNLIRFTLPIIATGILQLLYNAADMVVVGKFAPAGSLAAVSATGALSNLVVNFFLGFSVGACVVVAKHIGAADVKRTSRASHTSMVLSIISGFIIMILALCISRPALRWTGTPDDIIDRADIYMKIYFLGAPVNMFYTFGAAVLRAAGDIKRPLFILSISGVVNFILNLIFVIPFKMGVAGAAIATVISQAMSAVLIGIYLFKTDKPYAIRRKLLKINKAELKEIVRIGMPSGIQSCLFAFSNTLIQSSINSFGTLVIEGSAAASNIERFVYTAMNSVSQSTMTFTSQNLGAGKAKRSKNILFCSIGIVSVIGIVTGGLAYVFNEPLLKIFLNDPATFEYGAIRLLYIAVPYFLCGIMDVLAGSLRGLGRSIFRMIVSLLGAGAFRVVWILTVFAANPTLEVLYISYPVSWLLTGFAHFVSFTIVYKKITKEKTKI